MLLKHNQSVVHLHLVGADTVFSGEGWRDLLREKLDDHHFRDDGRPEPVRMGFVDPWHLGTVSFDDMTRWLFDPYLVVGFRIDRRQIPRNLFNATLQSKVAEWCAERGIERCPAAVRAELKEMLESEWMKRVLPRVKHLQLSIHTSSGDAHLFGPVSESDLDQVRRSAFRLFGARLSIHEMVRWGSLDGKSMDPLLERAESLGPLRPNVDEDGGEEAA